MPQNRYMFNRIDFGHSVTGRLNLALRVKDSPGNGSTIRRPRGQLTRAASVGWYLNEQVHDSRLRDPNQSRDPMSWPAT